MAWCAAWNVSIGEAYKAMGAEWDAVQDALDAAWHALYTRDTRDVWDAARVAAWNVWSVVLDATLALFAQHLITEEQFETLYGPWESVMGKGSK